MTASKKIGLKEIATAAGVSAMTVSSVLKDTGRVGTETRLRIKEIARKMGYHSNAAARLLKSKTIPDMGLLVFEDERLVRENAAFQAYNVLFTRQCRDLGIPGRFEWFDPVRHSDELPQMLTDGLVGGIIVAGMIPENSRKYIDGVAHLPWVQLGEIAPYCVSSCEAHALACAVDHLLTLGHCSFAILTGPDCIPAHARQCRELESLLAGDGRRTLTVGYDPVGDFHREIDCSADRILAMQDRPTALFCTSGVMARALAGEFFRRGVRVPEDISIIVYETSAWEADKFSPAFTAVETNYEPIMARAFAMLRDLIAGRKVEEPQLFIEPDFTVRESTSVPPQRREQSQ